MKDGQWRTGFDVGKDVLKQALSQAAVARGQPVVWHVAEADVAQLLRRTFAGRPELGTVTVVHTPLGATP